MIGKIEQKEKVVVYTWTIDDFCNIRKQYPPGKFIMSPSFYSDVNSQWQLIMYPQGDSTNDKELRPISIFMNYTSSTPVTAVILLSAIGNGQDEHIVEFSSREYMKRLSSHGFRKYLNFNNMYPTLCANSNKLIIKCKIKIDDQDCAKLHEQEAHIHFRIQEHQGFKQLFYNNKLSDIILIAEGKQIHAHKNILTIHSEVFAAMFEHDMTEKRENIVEIKDISSNVLTEMLRYIYVGKVNCIAEIASNLFVAANKYLIKNLKNMCEDTLCKEISTSNVFTFIEFAETHNALKLRAHAIQYIVSNAEKFIESKFKDLGDLDSYIINEIFEKLVIQRVKKNPE